MVDKIIRTLVFSPAKKGFYASFYIFVLCVSRKYQFIFPNIVFSINCNNPVRQQPVLHTEIWSHHQPVCLEWHEETEQTETD